MIVVDSNTMVSFKLQSKKSDWAVQAFQKDPEWIAPILWRSEFVNVLALYLRRNIITLEIAQRINDANTDCRGNSHNDPCSQFKLF